MLRSIGTRDSTTVPRPANCKASSNGHLIAVSQSDTEARSAFVAQPARRQADRLCQYWRRWHTAALHLKGHQFGSETANASSTTRGRQGSPRKNRSGTRLPNWRAARGSRRTISKAAPKQERHKKESTCAQDEHSGTSPVRRVRSAWLHRGGPFFLCGRVDGGGGQRTFTRRNAPTQVRQRVRGAHVTRLRNRPRPASAPLTAFFRRPAACFPSSNATQLRRCANACDCESACAAVLTRRSQATWIS